jgi:hypothetical protein
LASIGFKLDLLGGDCFWIKHFCWQLVSNFNFLGGDWFLIGLAWRPICRIEISLQHLVSILIFFAAIGFGFNFRVGHCFWMKHS